LIRLESGLCVGEDLGEMETPPLTFSLGNNLETCGEKFRCTLSDNHTRVSERHKNLVKDEVNVRMKVDWTIPGKFLQNEHAGIPARFLFVPLQQADGSRHFVVHEMFPKSRASNFSNLSEGLGSSKHDIEVAIGQKRFDIIVEAKKVLFKFDCFFLVHVEEMI
jgi:hypothetical protein